MVPVPGSPARGVQMMPESSASPRSVDGRVSQAQSDCVSTIASTGPSSTPPTDASPAQWPAVRKPVLLVPFWRTAGPSVHPYMWPSRLMSTAAPGTIPPAGGGTCGIATYSGAAVAVAVPVSATCVPVADSAPCAPPPHPATSSATAAAAAAAYVLVTPRFSHGEATRPRGGATQHADPLQMPTRGVAYATRRARNTQPFPQVRAGFRRVVSAA